MKKLLPFLALLAACGADQSEGAREIVISGQAAEESGTGTSPLGALKIEAYASSDDVTPVSMGFTDALGNFALTIPTPDGMFDGYLRASEQGYVDTYLYPPDELAGNYQGAPIRMIMPGLVDVLSTACAGDQLAGNGLIATVVTSDAHVGIGGVTVASTPAASKYCYNDADGVPRATQLTTAADGVAYLFNVTGPVTVSAMKSGATFQARAVTARADVLTMVLIE